VSHRRRFKGIKNFKQGVILKYLLLEVKMDLKRIRGDFKERLNAFKRIKND